jgi:hypothetical protein
MPNSERLGATASSRPAGRQQRRRPQWSQPQRAICTVPARRERHAVAIENAAEPADGPSERESRQVPQHKTHWLVDLGATE